MNISHVFVVIIILLASTVFWSFKGAAQQSDGQVTKAEFASEIIQALKRKDPESSFEYDVEHDRIEERPDTARNDTESTTPQIINLGNIYLRAKSMTALERAEFIDKFLDVSSETDEDVSTNEFLQSLAVRVRTKAELSNRIIYMARLEGDFPSTATESLGGLYLELVEDTEVAVKMVSNTELDNRKLLKKSAFDRGRQNLKDHTPEKVWQKEARHIWKSTLDDDYDGARLIAAYPDFHLPFDTNPIVYMPSHSICLITDSDEPDTLSKMIAIGEEYSVDQRPLSNSLWHFSENSWQQWLPKKNHPAYGVAKLQSIKTDLFDYNEQKTTLDEMHEESLEDIFVASLTAYENDDGGFFTLSVFTIGVDAILPKSDKVAIVEQGETEEDTKSEIVEWDEFVSLLGNVDLPVYKDYVPVRYDLTNHLSKKQLSSLRKKLTVD